ncbi:putative PurR-regulated permease PerM [Evansella vedderi]|uniref:PurR-regulated permease PerM n=1 Tax=Evansella vedderi TaxID=38282 RepID=A0ABU0A3D2_9BACI|nr:AI-2E family transporter [Evansella vedderi]MDQ0258002.1 putative PurR-regulated permease PerM [Evansella vedderi]
MLQSRFYRFLIAVILILIIVYLSTLVSFIFRPLVVFLQTVFIPFLVAGVLFYLFRPVVNLLHKNKVPKVLAILIIYIGFIGLLVGFFFLIGPPLQRQVMNLADNMPVLINEVRKFVEQLLEIEVVEEFFQQSDNFSIERISENITSVLGEAIDFISTNVATVVGAVTNALLMFIMIPFMLFYILKDGHKMPNQVLRFFPEKQQIEGKRILGDMDRALGSYIQGQIFVSFCVGVLMYISYLIIGIEYSLVLALVAMLTNLIPFIGPWIGAVPAVIVALITSPMMAIWVIVAIVVVQQIESNLISPQIMGKVLAVHPLTILILILVAGRFAGFIGFLIAVPTYAVLKVIVSHTYRLWQLKKKAKEEELARGQT